MSSEFHTFLQLHVVPDDPQRKYRYGATAGVTSHTWKYAFFGEKWLSTYYS
jgi:hypothetical protein